MILDDSIEILRAIQSLQENKFELKFIGIDGFNLDSPIDSSILERASFYRSKFNFYNRFDLVTTFKIQIYSIRRIHLCEDILSNL